MSNTADTTDRAHPIASAAAQIEDILEHVRDALAWSLDADETRRAMVRLTGLTARLAELEARVAAHGRIVEVAPGAFRPECLRLLTLCPSPLDSSMGASQ